MATNSFPALNIQAPQQQDILGQYGKALALKNMLQTQQYQQQMQPLQLQQEQQAVAQQTIQTQLLQQQQDDNKIIANLWKQNKGDVFKTNDALADAGVSPNGQIKFQQQALQLRENIGKADKATFEATKDASAQIVPQIQDVVNAPPEDQPALYTLTRNQIMRDSTLSKYAQALPPQYPGADQLNTFIYQHKTVEQLASDRTFAAEHGPMTQQQFDQSNAVFADRVRAAAPGLNQVPPELQLQKGPNGELPTQDEYKRLHENVQQIEQASQRYQQQQFTQEMARQRQSEIGTWQIQEQPGTGAPILFNTKTGTTAPAPIQKPGTQAKLQGPVNSVNYANNYLAGGQFTGPSDEALMEKFFDLAKPETGFRMSAPQQKMLKDSQSWMGSIQGKAYHAWNGTWFSPQQRQDIVKTMNDLLTSQVRPPNAPTPTPLPSSGTANPAASGSNWGAQFGGVQR